MTSLKLALRQLTATPGFTFVALITLAVGIGLNTAMFSVLNTFLLRPLSIDEPERVFRLDRVSAQGPEGSHRGPNYIDIERETRDIADLAAYTHWGYTLTDSGHPARYVEGLRVSAAFFDLLRIRPALGRAFRSDEDAAGRNTVILLSDRFWRSQYGADPNVIGRVVRLDREPVLIVGVLPPSGEVRPLYGVVDIFRPLGLSEEERSFRSETFFQVLGRYRPGVTPLEAQARFDVVAARLRTDRPQQNTGLNLRTVAVESTVRSDTGTTIMLLLVGLSGFVLLIGCANLASLLMARGLTRAREFAMRAALGASSAQLMSPVVLECLLLAGAGGVASFFLATTTTEWLGRQMGGDGPPFVFALDWRVLSFGIVAALLTVLLVGAAPAWLMARVDVNETLKTGTRGTTSNPSQHRFRTALIVGQIALTLVLLAGAAAFTHGLHRLLTRPAGWDPTPLLAGRILVGGNRTEDELFQFYRQLRDRLAALPGVKSASIDIDLPLFGFLPGQRAYVVEGQERPAPGHEPAAMTNLVSPEYFETVGTPIVRGRAILPGDRRDSPRVVVINETMASTLFPNGDAIGRRLGRVDKDAEWSEIVGIARDVRFLSLDAAPPPFQVYKPLAQETWGFVMATVRTADRPSAAALVEPFRRAVGEIAPEAAIISLVPVPSLRAQGNRSIAIVNQLLAGFAGVGLFLAALGLYGVITRLVVQRTTEIGVRMALGATIGHVIRLVLVAGFRMILIGVAVGLLGAVALTRLISTQLPGLATSNTATIAAAAALLLTVALLACYVPARRAARVDPLSAMRSN
jgi:predicted permease